MSKVSYDKWESSVRELFNQSRSWGMSLSESAGMTKGEYWDLIEDSELENMIVNLVIGKMFQEEKFFDQALYQDLLTHLENKTPERYKDHFDAQEYSQVVPDLEKMIQTWR